MTHPRSFSQKGLVRMLLGLKSTSRERHPNHLSDHLCPSPRSGNSLSGL
jgi:hypothetical protein